MTREEGQPGFINQKLLSTAGEVLDVSTSFTVDSVPCWFTHSQEVWPQTADGVLSDVRQRLTSSCSEQIAPHHFVDTGHILCPQRLVLNARQVDRKALSTDDHNKCEGDHDSSQQLVGYGVIFERVTDCFVITEETPFERAVTRGEDEEWQSNEDKAGKVQHNERDA